MYRVSPMYSALSSNRLDIDLDFSEICRTCRREIAGEMHYIKQAMYVMIEVTTGLAVSTEDLLPQQICSMCLKTMQFSFAFWQECQKVDSFLRRYFDAHKPNNSERVENENEKKPSVVDKIIEVHPKAPKPDNNKAGSSKQKETECVIGEGHKSDISVIGNHSSKVDSEPSKDDHHLEKPYNPSVDSEPSKDDHHFEKPYNPSVDSEPSKDDNHFEKPYNPSVDSEPSKDDNHFEKPYNPSVDSEPSKDDNHLEKPYNPNAVHYYNCKLCPYKTAVYIGIIRHYIIHHMSKTRHQCPICKEVCNKTYFRYHIRDHVPQMYNCGKHYREVSTLRRHVSNTLAEQPRVCPYCTNNLKRKPTLNIRPPQRIRVRDFKCEDLPKETVGLRNDSTDIKNKLKETLYKRINQKSAELPESEKLPAVTDELMGESFEYAEVPESGFTIEEMIEEDVLDAKSELLDSEEDLKYCVTE